MNSIINVIIIISNNIIMKNETRVYDTLEQSIGLKSLTYKSKNLTFTNYIIAWVFKQYWILIW